MRRASGQYISRFMVTAPFRQLRFEDVPDLPAVAHQRQDTPRSDVGLGQPCAGATRIAVHEYGPREAPPLVLVHGLMTAGYSFRYPLALLGNDRRLLIPDLPGA